MCIDEVCCIFPVHKLIKFEIRYLKEPVSKKRITFRLKRNFQPKLLVNSVTQKIFDEKGKICEHGVVESGHCVTCYVMLYNITTKEEFNTMCPLVEREIVVKDHAPWFNAEILRAKKEKEERKTMA